MNSYAAAALMWGIALGGLVYRYVMLPFEWSSSWSHLLPGALIGLSVAARQLLRQRGGGAHRERPAFAWLLGLGVVGAALSFGLAYIVFPTVDRVSIARREFPGFSIALPQGDTAEHRTDYVSGGFTLKNVGGANVVVAVHWEAGEEMTQDELKLAADVIAKGLHVKGRSSITVMPGPEGKPAGTILIEGEPSMLLSQLRCGMRRVFVVTTGGPLPRRLHERILTSFECQPNAALESSAKMEVPFVLDLPNWYLAAREPDLVQLTDGAEAFLVIRPLGGSLSLEKLDYDVLVRSISQAAGVEGRVTKREGDRVWLTMTTDGDSVEGWMRFVKCPTATTLVLALAAESSKLDWLHERVKAARCLRQGEKPQVWAAPPMDASVAP